MAANWGKVGTKRINTYASRKNKHSCHLYSIVMLHKHKKLTHMIILFHITIIRHNITNSLFLQKKLQTHSVDY